MLHTFSVSDTVSNTRSVVLSLRYLRRGCYVSLCLFVCLLAQDYAKNILNRDFTKFGGKVTHEPRKKRLDFGVNPDLDPDPGIIN